MARDRQFFRWAAKIDRRYDVPVTSLIVQGIWCSILALSGTYNQLATYVVFIGFLFYGMSSLAVIVLRQREPGMVRPYRAWGYPVTPIVFLAFSAYLVVNTIREQPLDSAIGAGLLAIGLVFYYGFGWHRSDSPLPATR
jgi:APA family basic amino acid/polyamine antiporter